MKLAFNKYWMIIALIIIINIFIFVFLSNKLESYVADQMIDQQIADLQFKI